MPTPATTALIILDGWGHRLATAGNAIASAATPTWDTLWQHYPHSLLSASGAAVGLPEGQMGNSEVGHFTLGMGRSQCQDLTRINQAIDNGQFAAHPHLLDIFQQAQRRQQTIHLVGLLSDGGVHSHVKHWRAMLALGQQFDNLQLLCHPILDGRDTAPQNAKQYLETLVQWLHTYKVGEIASMMGRFYAMDRDHRWARTEAAFRCIAEAQAPFAAHNPLAALQQAYQRGETDEFVQPIRLHPQPIQADDWVIVMNFRADRAKQLCQALTEPDFSHFKRAHHCRNLVTLTDYPEVNVTALFPKPRLQGGLGDILSHAGLRQLRLAETEKFAHVTYFFDGGQTMLRPGQEHIVVPSPKVTTYDETPAMSAEQLTDHFIASLETGQHDVVICNYANADMVGHTGKFEAAVQAVEAIDRALTRLLAKLEQHQGRALITADHGNVECLIHPDSSQPHTAHTTAPVPLVYYTPQRPARLQPQGSLQDVAPTLLDLLNLPPSGEMTGNSLLHAG